MRRLIAKLLFVSVLVAGAVAMQSSFPHTMGPPGVKIEYMGKSRLPQETKEAISDLVFHNLNPYECVRTGYTLQQEIDTIRVAEANLSGEGKDLLVQASDMCNCGGTGNCSFWILHQKPDGFETLLDTHMVQQFSVEPGRSHGFHDLMTASHGSAFLQDLVLYQFDGKQYRASQCARVEYHLSDKKKDGHETVSDEPTISPAEPCSPD